MAMASERKNVLDESFEVRSVRLTYRLRQYDRIQHLVHELHTVPSADTVYCAASCILVLAARLDACQKTRDDLAAQLAALSK